MLLSLLPEQFGRARGDTARLGKHMLIISSQRRLRRPIKALILLILASEVEVCICFADRVLDIVALLGCLSHGASFVDNIVL